MVAYLSLVPVGLVPAQTIIQTHAQAREGTSRLSFPAVHGKYAGTTVNMDSDSTTCFLNAVARANQYGSILSSSAPLDLDFENLVSISLLTTKNKDFIVDFSYDYPECEKSQDLQPHFVVSVTHGDGMLRGDMMGKGQLKEKFSPMEPRFSLSTDQPSSESLAPLILSVFMKSNERERVVGSLNKWSQMTIQDQRATGNRKIVRALRNVLPRSRFDSLLATLPRRVSNSYHSNPESRQSKR